MNSGINNISAIFTRCGFKVIHMVEDDFYLITPESDEERNKYGQLLFSPRAMKALEQEVNSCKEGSDDRASVVPV